MGAMLGWAVNNTTPFFTQPQNVGREAASGMAALSLPLSHSFLGFGSRFGVEGTYAPYSDVLILFRTIFMLSLFCLISQEHYLTSLPFLHCMCATVSFSRPRISCPSPRGRILCGKTIPHA